jgi:hypothetical protein
MYSKLKSISSFIICFFCLIVLRGQSASMAEQVANSIANRLKDSLGLTESQRLTIYQINIQLSSQKKTFRQQYSGNDSLITIYMQRVENKRDSLYRPVLGEVNYSVYKQKKRNLITSN